MKLKINQILALLFLSIFLFSCSSDDNSSEIQDFGDETTQIPVKEVLDNLIIENATKKEGEPSTPNEAITFELLKDNTSAIQSEGFDIKFKAEGVEGIYLQIKNKDGEVADGYYDIKINNRKSTKKTKSTFLTKTINTNDIETKVDVDFKPAIEPGTFCYVVCVYDAEGNISAPQEVCVTVESWGGNDNLVGNWNFTKEIQTFDGETTTIPVGESDCEENTFYCSTTGADIPYTYCFTINSFEIEFKADGTVTYEVKSFDDDIDYQQSTNNCEIVEDDDNEEYRFKGNWSYNADERKVIMVIYEETEIVNGTTESETYELGDADIYELEVSFDGSNLVLTENLDLDGLYKYYFERK